MNTKVDIKSFLEPIDEIRFEQFCKLTPAEWQELYEQRPSIVPTRPLSREAYALIREPKLANKPLHVFLYNRDDRNIVTP